MDISELYLGLVTNKIAISEALALTAAFVPLSEAERLWVMSELNGYDDKTIIPDYRQLPCEIKARVQNNYSGATQDTRLVGPPMKELDSLLKERFGLSIYTLYVTQNVESIEKQVLSHNDGDIIMVIEGPPGEDLKESLHSLALQYNFTTQYVFQTARVAYMQNALSVIKNKLISILQPHVQVHKDQIRKIASEAKGQKTVFVSYCWESEEHKDWVHRLANDLSKYFTVIIDKELPYGVELTQFMEEAISTADKVLIITTPEYKERADNRIRGVGYETSLITDDLVNDQNRIKFIPIIRKGTKETSYPRYLGSRKGADMTDDSKYDEILNDLINNLNKY